MFSKISLYFHSFILKENQGGTAMSYDVEKNIDLSFKTMNLFLTGITSIFEVTEGLLEYCNQDPAANLLKKHIKSNGDLEFTACKKELAPNLEEKFRNAGIVFLRTQNLANGGVTLFVYPSKDRERVEQILNDFRAEHRESAIIDNSTMAAYSKGCVRSVNKLTYEEAVLFTEHAEKKGIPLVVEEPKQGAFKIIYAEKDQEIINRIKANVAMELSGLAGDALKKQLFYEERKAEYQTDLILNYEKSEPFYLVDLKGHQMKVDKKGVTYQSKDGVITVERTEPDFIERTNALYLGLKCPVFLSETQKREFENEPEKKKYLVEREKEQGRPSYSKEEYLAIREMMLKREMYEMKLALAEPDQAVFDICLENDEMRLATFEEYNDLNEEKANSSFTEKDERLFSEIREKMNNYVDTPEILDYEQIDFERDILDGMEHDFIYDRDMMDLQHDKNNNLMPDQYEK